MALPTPANLTDYEQQTQRLLNDPTSAEYNIFDLDIYINTARGRIAAATQCLRFTGSFVTAANVQNYPMAQVAVPTGVQNALNVRMLTISISSGYKLMEERPWEWFFTYFFSVPAPVLARPQKWAVQEQGPLGFISLYPIPDQPYIIFCDTVGYPITLTGPGDPEALPYTYTDAVPYFAAFMAYMAKQRLADAEALLQQWMMFSTASIRDLTMTVLPEYFPGGKGAYGAATKIPVTGMGAGPSAGGGGTAVTTTG